MAPPAKQAAGVLEDLKGIYSDISNLMLDPDAGQHAQFIQGLQQAILKYIQQQQQLKAQQAAQAQQAAAQQALGGGQQQPGQMPGGGPGGRPGGPPMGGPSQAGQGAPPPPGGGASPQGAQMPNPDELRRVLGGQQTR
jgi:hypothetical protein